MHCPNCKSENNDSAKFCKKCGTPLKNKPVIISTETIEKSNNDSTKYIIIALIIIAIALAGTFAYIGFSGNNDEQVQNSNPVQTTATTTSQSTSAMTILGGTFHTGSSLSSKTEAKIYVGTDHYGENAVIQIKYSRDGSSLNPGNMVPVTVDSSGYINVNSADPYKYYPDYAEINLFDTNNNLLDSVNVKLTPNSSTQSF